MNTIKDSERSRIILYACKHVRLQADGKTAANRDEVIADLIHKFKISQGRAEGYARNAASLHRSIIRRFVEQNTGAIIL